MLILFHTQALVRGNSRGFPWEQKSSFLGWREGALFFLYLPHSHGLDWNTLPIPIHLHFHVSPKFKYMLGMPERSLTQ